MIAEEKEMRNALICLYLEVDASIADDVTDKFNAYIKVIEGC